jgi:hypothetical protein
VKSENIIKYYLIFIEYQYLINNLSLMEYTVKRLFYQRLRDFIYHIPGENPSEFTLCGTNCFVVGSGINRIMIESGDYPERN